jgi:hypothetical protein
MLFNKEECPMTALRQRFIDDLQLQGMSPRTQAVYVRAVRMFAQHYGKSPDLITEEELRQYFLYIKNNKKWSRATITQALCGIKFFFEQTLRREWTTLDIIRPPKESRLPVIPTLEEVQRLLHPIRLLRYRACLTPIYSWGLGLKEGTHLQVRDIDSPRMLGLVRLGKGGKDRSVPLPQCPLDLLRAYWKTHRNPVWLFPATGRGGIGAAITTEPLEHLLPVPSFLIPVTLPHTLNPWPAPTRSSSTTCCCRPLYYFCKCSEYTLEVGFWYTIQNEKPEINIKQGTMNIPSGTGSYNFGTVNVGSSTAVIFTIENTGTANLLLTGTPKVAISGANAGDFSVTQQPISPVGPNGSTTFTLRFAPTATSTRTATVSIVNNDSDENP